MWNEREFEGNAMNRSGDQLLIIYRRITKCLARQGRAQPKQEEIGRIRTA
jgi:hypothetical protein